MLLPRLTMPDPAFDDSGIRWYQTPSGRLPSVSSILKATEDPRNTRRLEKWRARTGEAEAAKCVEQASARGNILHEMIANYFTTGAVGSGPWWKSIQWILSEMYDPRLIEAPVYYQDLFAGTVDLVVHYKDKLYTVDLKTSAKRKKLSYIDSYGQQVAAYNTAAKWLYEDYGLRTDGTMILVAYESGEPSPGSFFPFDDYETTLYWNQFYAKAQKFRDLRLRSDHINHEGGVA